jgi:hypothetical protein
VAENLPRFDWGYLSNPFSPFLKEPSFLSGAAARATGRGQGQMGQMGQNPFLRPIMIGGVRIIASLDMVAVVEDWSRVRSRSGGGVTRNGSVSGGSLRVTGNDDARARYT